MKNNNKNEYDNPTSRVNDIKYDKGHSLDMDIILRYI